MVLEDYRFQDSLIVQWRKSDKHNRQLLAWKDSAVVVLQQQLQNHKRIQKNQQESLYVFQQTLAVQEEYLRKSKRQKTWMGVGMGLLTLALFIN